MVSPVPGLVRLCGLVVQYACVVAWWDGESEACGYGPGRGGGSGVRLALVSSPEALPAYITCVFLRHSQYLHLVQLVFSDQCWCTGHSGLHGRYHSSARSLPLDLSRCQWPSVGTYI